MPVKFNEIWTVFSTGRGQICGLDTISLSVVFRIAEMQLRGDKRGARLMCANFLRDQDITLEQLYSLVQEIEKNTKFNGTIVLNADGSRRYENLADVGFMITKRSFETVVITSSGVESAFA
ncbi:MAG: hypothetical protein AAB792_00145 [Patescibacteria group bacterium]